MYLCNFDNRTTKNTSSFISLEWSYYAVQMKQQAGCSCIKSWVASQFLLNHFLWVKVQ